MIHAPGLASFRVPSAGCPPEKCDVKNEYLYIASATHCRQHVCYIVKVEIYTSFIHFFSLIEGWLGVWWFAESSISFHIHTKDVFESVYYVW